MTLLELLLTLTVMSLLVGALVVTMRGADDARTRAVAAVTKDQQLRSALSLLRDDLEGARLVASAAVDTFVGDDDDEMDTLEFVTTNPRLPAQDLQMGLTLIRWSLVPEDEAAEEGTQYYVLVRGVSGNVYQTNERAYESQVLVRGLSGWSLRYLGSSGWVDEWDSAQTEALPGYAHVQLFRDLPREQAQRAADEGKDFDELRLLGQSVMRLPLGESVDLLF